jgi:hypothetical protein
MKSGAMPQAHAPDSRTKRAPVIIMTVLARECFKIPL